MSALAASGLMGGALAAFHALALAYNTRLYGPAHPGKAVLVHLSRTALLVVGLVALAMRGFRPFAVAVVAFACVYAAMVPLVSTRRQA
jgi:hypothetical protein